MLQVTKIEPKFFSDKKRKIKKPKESTAWKELADIREDLRKHILDVEQNNMCIYCQKHITANNKKSNIDHYKTRKLYPELTLDYENLFVSCNHNSHCSSHKDRLPLKRADYQNILNPLSKELEGAFDYTSFGEIEPLNQKAKITQECFNLNHISLVEERKLIIQNFDAYRELDEDILVEYLGGYIDLIRELKKAIKCK
jgi:uncharacterized protein (TIGR02646 family)